MNILSQILEISSKNFLVNQFSSVLKQKLHLLIDNFTLDKGNNRYSNFFILFQEFMNQFSCSFFY